jgi:3',5'-cyclic AMP phosphodiesterase CpdA
MRILHVTDFHFNQRWFDWLARRGGEYDAVCFTGDFVTMFAGPRRLIPDAKPSSLARLMAPSLASNLRDQARWVRDWLSDWPTIIPLFLCTGNHDYWPQREHFIDTDAEGGWLRKTRRPGNVWADENASTLLGGHRFVCAPWAGAPKTETAEPIADGRV